MNDRIPRRLPLAMLMVGAMVLTACGTSSGTEPTDGPDNPPPGGNGDGSSVYISGSSTVEPISLAVAEKFAAANSGFSYRVDGPGTGDGFALFCNDETDISDASRAIKDEEAQACEENGIEYTELLIARDGLSVLTSNENSAVDCLSFLDLYALIGPESQGFTSWADANDLAAELEAELGTDFGQSHAPYPDEVLTITAPGEESGTYDTFVEIVLAKTADARDQNHEARPDYIASANDNVIIEGIAGTPTSLGWVGLAFARENADVVKEIEIDKGDGCVGPSDETVTDGSYPISRPLYIYVNKAGAEANPALAGFVDYYLSDEGIASVGEVGYVDLSADEIEETRAAWNGR